MPNPQGAYALQTRRLNEGKPMPGIKKWPCHHNHPGNKRIYDYHYYPDPEWVPQQPPADGNPRGLSTTGRVTADKVRDLRLRHQLTGTDSKPKPPQRETPMPEPWKPPKWIIQALEDSGDTHLLYESGQSQDYRSRQAPAPGSA